MTNDQCTQLFETLGHEITPYLKCFEFMNLRATCKSILATIPEEHPHYEPAPLGNCSICRHRFHDPLRPFYTLHFIDGATGMFDRCELVCGYNCYMDHYMPMLQMNPSFFLKVERETLVERTVHLSEHGGVVLRRSMLLETFHIPSCFSVYRRRDVFNDLASTLDPDLPLFINMDDYFCRRIAGAPTIHCPVFTYIYVANPEMDNMVFYDTDEVTSEYVRIQ